MKNFPLWMSLQTRRASVARRWRPCSECLVDFGKFPFRILIQARTSNRETRVSTFVDFWHIFPIMILFCTVRLSISAMNIFLPLLADSWTRVLQYWWIILPFLLAGYLLFTMIYFQISSENNNRSLKWYLSQKVFVYFRFRCDSAR